MARKGLADIFLFATFQQQHHSLTISSSSRRSPSTVTEHFRILRRVHLNDDIDVGQIESSGGDIRAEKDARRRFW
jgi:hypothetical protein